MGQKVQLTNIENPEHAWDEQLDKTIFVIDEYIQLLNNMYDEETGGEDPTNQELMRKVYDLCALNNNWMRTAGYPDEELYDI